LHEASRPVYGGVLAGARPHETASYRRWLQQLKTWVRLQFDCPTTIRRPGSCTAAQTSCAVDRPPVQVDLWPFDLESGVTCDVGYLCASFSLHRPRCSRLGPDVCDRQASDVRRASSLNAPYPRGGVV